LVGLLCALSYRIDKLGSLSFKAVVVPPEYWDTGAAYVLFVEMVRRAFEKGYEWADISLPGEVTRTPGISLITDEPKSINALFSNCSGFPRFQVVEMKGGTWGFSLRARRKASKTFYPFLRAVDR
jgi:hypothetical protein